MKTINREQMKKLEAVLFWRRELHILKNANKTEWELDQTRKAISYKIDECDKLEIPFSVQNAVLNYEDVHTDIIDVLNENNIKVV